MNRFECADLSVRSAPGKDEMKKENTHIKMPQALCGARRALTSIPWPGDRGDVPVADGIASQIVPLFEPHIKPRLRRYLLLCAAERGLPPEITVKGVPQPPPTTKSFSLIRLKTLRENLDKRAYVYRESEARLTVAGREIGLRLGLLPSNPQPLSAMPRPAPLAGATCPASGGVCNPQFSWWQWCGAERLWSGPLAEAWRVGGSLLPYTTDRKVDLTGYHQDKSLLTMADQIGRETGDSLHGDLFIIVWKSGCVQITAHFRAGYFHNWPKPIPAFPVVCVSGLKGTWPSRTMEAPALAIAGGAGDTLDLAPSGLMFTNAHAGLFSQVNDDLIFQPWQDLRVLANKTKENQLYYLDPAVPEVMPAGVSRTFMFNIGLDGAPTSVARYQVPASWYKACGVIETDSPGPAAEMAARSLELIKEHTTKGGFDTGFVWRYLRRDARTGIPQEDGAEWEGNLAQGMFTLAYQRAEDPAACWELYLQHAYHAADIAVYHGSWMGRLEGSVTFSAPLPKCRFGGILTAYLETGDPYLLEICHSMAGVFMAMEWSRQPRFCMGRDAYPLTSLMALWDYTAEALYLDFARQTAIRLLATQVEDGGFDGQAGAGTFAGGACLSGMNSISFGSGLLAPIAILEWATRDNRRPDDFIPRLRQWADLMLRLQPPDGVWLQGGTGGNPYALIGSGALFSLIKAGEILNDSRCIEAVRKCLKTMNARNDCVNGTHSFLSALYAHVADAALTRMDKKFKRCR